MDIAQRVKDIREQIARAALAAGRKPEEILLCAATKTNPPELIRQAIAAGVDACGENRVQELVQKQPQGAYTGAPVHFIGHLQSNKAKQVVGKVDLIQSVDSPELLELIDRLARAQGIRQDILLEVKLAQEESKSGFSPQAAALAAARMEDYPGLRLRGLMAIPPAAREPGENRPYFAELHQLFVDIKGKSYHNETIDCLSMGMSGDFCDAILEGSTMIRLGTAIFGPRQTGPVTGPELQGTADNTLHP